LNIPRTETLLPTSRIGAYRRPQWSAEQLRGRENRTAFTEVTNDAACHDATEATIHGQKRLDSTSVADGPMDFDDFRRSARAAGTHRQLMFSH
jgi:methionine synthase II (cobalamin-independent)